MLTPIEIALLKGYSHSDAGHYPDSVIEQYNLLVIRGTCVDSIFKNDAYGRQVVAIHNRKTSKKKAGK